AIGTAPHRPTRRLPTGRCSNHVASADSPKRKETNMATCENPAVENRPEFTTAGERAALLAAWAKEVEELRALADDEAIYAWVDQIDPAWDAQQLLRHQRVLRAMHRDQPVPPPNGAPVWTIEKAVGEQLHRLQKLRAKESLPGWLAGLEPGWEAERL